MEKYLVNSHRTQQGFICSKLTKETLEEVKYVQS